MGNDYLTQLNADFTTFTKQNLPASNLAGMDIGTGKWLTLSPHIVQQLEDLMLTPRGVTIMYPDYGSAIMYYMDMPVTTVGIDLQIEVNKVIKKYETRITLINTTVKLGSSSNSNLSIEYANNNGEVNSVNI